MKATEIAYLNYGVPSHWIQNYIDKGLTITVFRSTSRENLINRYGIEESEVDFVKICIEREPIDNDTLQNLLERNNFLCCLCKGEKSASYIIHHIQEYSKTQDNNYSNLAVLCPNHHDEAHKQGKALTNKITPDNIRKAKEKWEKLVEKENVRKATLNGDVHEIDYLNYHRIIELHSNINGGIPKSKYFDKLLKLGALNPDGFLNMDFIKQHNDNPETPLKFFAGFGSWDLRLHYFDLFNQCLKLVDFVDLDDLLTKKVILNSNIIGRYCYYVGGLYGKRPDKKNLDKDGMTHIYLRRKPFFVEWKVDPQYLVSSTAQSRLKDRTIYLVYGIVRNIGKIVRNNEELIHIDIRPYSFGIPVLSKDRTPLIHYIKDQEDYSAFFDNE